MNVFIVQRYLKSARRVEGRRRRVRSRAAIYRGLRSTERSEPPNSPTAPYVPHFWGKEREAREGVPARPKTKLTSHILYSIVLAFATFAAHFQFFLCFRLIKSLAYF